jgi:hypothetical protein
LCVPTPFVKKIFLGTKLSIFISLFFHEEQKILFFKTFSRLVIIPQKNS